MQTRAGILLHLRIWGHRQFFREVEKARHVFIFVSLRST